MEELQSTEILDREILEDARKKAQRILKSADDAARAESANWEKKTTAALDEMRKKYAQQGVLATQEIMTLLPIDQRRAKAKKIEELLNEAVGNWFASLSRKSVLALLQQELEQRIGLCDGLAGTGKAQGIRATIHKLDRTEAQAILRAVLPGRSCTIEETYSASPYPELVLETHDARIYASIGKTVDFFLNERRAELVEALIGGEGLC